MTFLTERICRVCGFFSGDCLRDKYGCPSYIICEKCGTEAGYEDETFDDASIVREFLSSKYPHKIQTFPVKNLEYKIINEILIEIILNLEIYSIYAFKEKFLSNNLIDMESIFNEIIFLIIKNDFEYKNKAVISALLYEIGRTNFPVSPDQHQILKSYADRI